MVGEGARGVGLDGIRGKTGDMGTVVLLDGFAGLDDLGDGFAGLDDLGDALEDGGLLIEPARKSPLVLGNRW